MKSIFDPYHNAELLARLSSITPETPRLWGKMSAAQMFVHCQKPLDVTEGKLFIPRLFIGRLFGKMFKNRFLSGKPLSKNGPTAKQFIVTENHDFESAKTALSGQISRFGEKGASVIASSLHPLFGELTDEEWGQLQFVHIDHHLKQFGA